MLAFNTPYGLGEDAAVPPPKLTCPEGQAPTATYPNGAEQPFVLVCKEPPPTPSNVPNGGCSWYQKPRGGTTAVNDPGPHCEFDAIRAFQAPAMYVLSPLQMLGFSNSEPNALAETVGEAMMVADGGKFSPLISIIAAAIWGGAGYALYSMSKKGGN